MTAFLKQTPIFVALAFVVSVTLFSIITLLIRAEVRGPASVSEAVQFDFIRIPQKARDIGALDEIPAPQAKEPPPTPELDTDTAEIDPGDLDFHSKFDASSLTRFSGLAGNLAASREAVPILRIAPLYPPRASSRGLEGWVEVGFTITVSGATKDVTVIREEPSGVFGRAAVRAVRKWKYKPQKVDGVVQERTGQSVVIQFKLDEEQ